MKQKKTIKKEAPQHKGLNTGWKMFKNSLVTPDAAYDAKKRFKERMERTPKTEPEKNSQVSFPMEEAGDLYRIYEGKKPGFFYARFGTGAEAALRERLVLAEAGHVEDAGLDPHTQVGALVFPSGMSAISEVAMELVRHIPMEERKGLRFMQGKTVYYTTNTVLSDRMQEIGLEPALKVDTTRPEEVEKALEEHRGMIVALFYETVTNPLLEFTDTREIAKIAQKYGVPVVIDNTFLTPYIQQPLRLGADIVIHSMTKYISGYGDMMGGAVVGPAGFINSLRIMQYDHGCVLQSTDIARTFHERLGRLQERMEQHLENAGEISKFLRSVDHIERIHYPTLSEQDTRYGSPGAVISFDLEGRDDEERKRSVCAMLRYIATRPGPVTYKASLGEEGHLLEENDHGPGLMRFAVGRVPGAGEVIEFLKQAFRQVFSDRR